MVSEIAVQFDDVSKSFRGNSVFRGVSFAIEVGGSYGLTGPNGSGKSVLLQMIATLVRPDSGRVIVAPEYLSKDRTFPDWFGISINGPAFIGALSAFDNLKTLAQIRKRADDGELLDTLTEVGLDPHSPQPVRSFSMGMKQKLSLAQAFIESPRVLLLDEPFNALDESSVSRVGDALRARQEAGVTLILTSHHPEEIKNFCDSRLSILDGTVSQSS